MIRLLKLCVKVTVAVEPTPILAMQVCTARAFVGLIIDPVAPTGTCDPDGCDFNSYRMQNESFYGPGKIVDTNSKMTVVTQFIAESGSLSEIKRFYVQNGNVIANAESNVDGVSGNSITPDFCTAQKEAFGDQDIFAQHGGFQGVSQGLEAGVVLVMSKH